MDAHAAGGAAVPFRDLLRKMAGGMDPEQKRRKLLKEHSFPEDYLDPVYTCSRCQDTGLIGQKRCSCFEREVISLFYTQSNLAKVLEEENFSTFDMSFYPEDLKHPRTGKSSREIMEAAAAACRQFADGYMSGSQSDFLLLTGRAGVGKTFLTHCIAKELIDNGHSVIYYSAGELFDKLAESKFSKMSDEPDAIIDDEYLSGCDLLIIDDLGTELVNSFVGSALFQLLNSRISSGLGMVISTNLSMDQIADRYSPQVASRIGGLYRELTFFGEDIRLKDK
jgi:DNA replication protein DnaC